MNLKEARSIAAAEIGAAGIERPWLEADLIISFITGFDRSIIHARPETPLPDGILPELLETVSRRVKREPLQYIIGTCQFMGLSIAVGPGCLIPRPETELLVLESRKYFLGGSFLDWGTGSGCIAASILCDNPGSRCIAVEKEPRAIMWAWKNLRSFGLLKRCLVWHSDDLRRVSVPPSSLEMIVSNPPYIPSGDISSLMPEVSIFEPHAALDGAADGLRSYRQILPWSAAFLKPGGVLLLEIGDSDQANNIESMASGIFLESIVLDIQGLPRVLVFRK